MSETKKPKYTKALSLKDSYTLDEVISIAESIQNRQAPPKTKKGKELYNALEPFVKKIEPEEDTEEEKKLDSICVVVRKYYNTEGDVLRIDKSPSYSWGRDAYFDMITGAREFYPQGTVYVRLFASYDGRTLDPVPVSEFPIHELDLSTPDFHTG